MRGVTRYVRSRLHRRLFVWFGATILATGLAVALALHFVGGSQASWQKSWDGARGFLGDSFAASWDDPVRRDAVARALVRELGASVVLEDPRGGLIQAYGEACPHPDLTTSVHRDEVLLGTLRVCLPRQRGRPGWSFFVVLAVGGLTLWGASGMVARRVVRPLGEVARVANEIGRGNLGTRVTLRRNRVGEIAQLADAVNEMADRIERQMADQRELLAGVSHEIRSPLARLRVLAEMARDAGTSGSVADEIEREILEIDSLVGQLLASSRLDFDALDRRKLDARDVAEKALERAGLPATLLDVGAAATATAFEADPTLLARALSNLLDNAKRHGGGATALRLRRDGAALVFEVEDRGPGIAEADLPKVFEKFVRGEKSAGSSLGLGLSLVRRIAEAHGGRAFAENASEGGARVGFSIPA